MGMLDRYRKRRAIKAFSRNLSSALSERFGRTPYYTADQIGDVLDSRRFRRHREYLAYAYCMFMSQKDFEAMGDAGDFQALRDEAFAQIGPGVAPWRPDAFGDPFPGPDMDPGDGGGF